MKTAVDVSIVLMFLIFWYVGVDPDEVAFKETYEAFDPLLTEQIDNNPSLTLFGFVWSILPLLFTLFSALVLLIAFYTIAQSVGG
jgi:hypothetical protein